MCDLDTLKEFVEKMELIAVRSGTDVLEVHAGDAIVLEFHNLPDENDTLVGFQGTSWHYHGVGMFCSGQNTYLELDELELLTMWREGGLLLFESYRAGILKDRWLAHKDEVVEVDALESGEEVRVRRIFQV